MHRFHTPKTPKKSISRNRRKVAKSPARKAGGRRRMTLGDVTRFRRRGQRTWRPVKKTGVYPWAFRLSYPLGRNFRGIDQRIFKAVGKFSEESGAGLWKGGRRDHSFGARSQAVCKKWLAAVLRLRVKGLRAEISKGGW